MGWNELRNQIFANQKRLGIIPADTDRGGLKKSIERK